MITIAWMNIHIREKSEAHMFNLSKKKLLPAGWEHFFFSLIEMTLILSLFFLDLRSFFGYFSLFLLSLFFASFFITSKHIHKRMIISDLVISLFGIVVILIKFLFSIF